MKQTQTHTTSTNKADVQTTADRYRLWQAEEPLRSLADQGVLFAYPDGSFTLLGQAG